MAIPRDYFEGKEAACRLGNMPSPGYFIFSDWRPWFAWFPVRVWDGGPRWVWWEMVMRARCRPPGDETTEGCHWVHQSLKGLPC